MQFAVLMGFVLAASSPLLNRWFGERTSLVLALFPALMSAWLFSQAPAVMSEGPLLLEWSWVPSLGISLSFLLDGLSLLFGLLITVIGTFVLIYAGGYLKGHTDIARFHLALVAFMASMLGLVLADGLLTLFVFWELTSITSYLLIGFNHTDMEARKSARQGLFVTVAGGLALMAGLVLLGGASGSWSFYEIGQMESDLREHSLYTPMLICLLLGAFTKSAQFPFHFWLPSAMAAPTPVSAYLHSATMVKAGIYLLARLHPELGGTALWIGILSVVGAITMLTGAFLAIHHTNIKKLLAYSTIMALGTLTMLLGIGSEYAMTAFVTFLLAHSMYKGALFMVAGILDHETGTKDVTAMGGLRSAMPITAVIAFVVALSLAGVPPLFGFIGKELMLEAALGAERFNVLLVLFAFLAAILTIAVAAIIAFRPFYGRQIETPKTPHEAPFSMLVGPAVLALGSLVLGLAPAMLGTDALLTSAATAVVGEPLQVSLSLWYGINMALIMSIVSLGLGFLLFKRWDSVRCKLAMLAPLMRHGPEAGYEGFMNSIVRFSEWQTRLLQNGYMRNYILVMLVVLIVLIGNSILVRHAPQLALTLDVRFHEVIVVGTMVMGALFATISRSRLGAVVSVGIMGFSIALIFILFSAPDLGITQLLVETLTVILLVLVLFRLPRFSNLSTNLERIRDGAVAATMGILIFLLIMTAWSIDQFEPISAYMIENSAPLAYGRNIVNVILVDYRALDTLGEMFVLALAAIGVIAMLKLRHGDNESKSAEGENGENASVKEPYDG
ncbi:MAG: putative monovalent cation/H+ antiporter subunit A [Vreelandella alkaliphila]|uniref:Putative monovalent cation/H+ antiporter subunit A n=1 Tax=Halomonas campaniensis TaxID=213554 RepID=A0A3D0KID1_9GAMM|nr:MULTISPECIES: putative monovalent cation/H+ antiporter subunit A [unclassified Halomonas]HBP40787.1 putative monovalent cation/H+ antiporter subunit A [Halomonas sp.]HBS83356.1 putative monovalent cation/H+ antiporter subunit A [Halomonas campaniensis]HCA02961.1 putative monovalent cation/H+ antiporter subunit A [Halomonas campaniensis]